MAKSLDEAVPTRPVTMHGYPPAVPPMTDGDYVNINAALRDLETLIGNLSIACDAGAPAQDQLTGCEELKRRYELWKVKYFPGRP